MNQKEFINILLIIVVVTLIGGGIYVVLTRQTLPPVSTSTTTSTPAPSGEEIIKKVGEKEGSFLIQKINPDSVEGLWFDIYPIERPNEPGTPKTLFVGDDVGYACEGVSKKLISINFPDQTVVFDKIVGQRPLGGCPICLASNSLIDTPSGLVTVKDLRVGMLVWTTNQASKRVPGIITKTSKVRAPSTHKMVRLVLSDGRELLVSPGHPTIDGRTVGDILPGEIYNGVSVISIKRVSYSEDATYDILPSGNTGFYWANGILIGSTLR